ncbi:hypothetical protein HMPREF1544_01785 [Mucor circinelloides 1006PhL]|uniref:Uncharacterized protein n=1 Tax=Mucor circinelloides f. circinelloides (strain 1006PhL) TaxID=1220926 RepID=S2JMR6_MUCC1|nr:hypothetical protein HMPREF1544_01785 [Mucor circinelloides 1006PhL]
MLPSLLKHPSHVEQISQHLTTDLKLFKQYGILFLEQLSDQIFAIKPIIVLSCFNRYFAQHLADNKESLKDIVDEARLIMFSYCLKLSDAWTRLLKHASNSPLHAEFNVVVQLTEKALWNIQAEHLQLPSLQKTAFDTNSAVFFNRQEFENTLRECLKSLHVAHTMYISTIAYSLIQLIQYARISYNDDDQFQAHITNLSQATWFELVQSLLSDAVFETLPCEESTTVVRLFKVAACYIQFRLVLKLPHTEFPMSIWDHYYLQRSIFLKSTGITDNILLIEKVVFTSTCVLY